MLLVKKNQELSHKLWASLKTNGLWRKRSRVSLFCANVITERDASLSEYERKKRKNLSSCENVLCGINDATRVGMLMQIL